MTVCVFQRYFMISKSSKQINLKLKQTLIPLPFAAFLLNIRLVLLPQFRFDPQFPFSASQEAMLETAERLTEMEKALRESMNTSAHREALWAQEESARIEAQRQVDMH